METKKLIGGLLAGAALGVAIGILLAPRSGKETIGNIAKGSKRLAADLKGTVDDSIESLKVKYNNGVDETARRGKDLIGNASDRVKA